MPLTTFLAGEVLTLHPGALQCRLSAAGLSTPPTGAAVDRLGWLIGLVVLWRYQAPPRKDMK